MSERGLARFAPLTGAAFVVLTAIAFTIAGEPPDFDAAPREVVEFYRDNEGANILGSVLLGLASVLLIFFSASLRRTLRRSEMERACSQRPRSSRGSSPPPDSAPPPRSTSP